MNPPPSSVPHRSGHISRDCPQSENGSSGFGGVSTTTETSATKTNEDEDRPVINWKELFMMAEENKMAKWKDEPPIVKHFYTEHPDVTREIAASRSCIFLPLTFLPSLTPLINLFRPLNSQMKMNAFRRSKITCQFPNQLLNQLFHALSQCDQPLADLTENGVFGSFTLQTCLPKRWRNSGS